ncbi:MAG TPA: DUF4148 domain-containing protein [Aquabacterium sp.]|nr:DUF4148 domain-containing protein [Aquabacterium sp.]
MNAKTLATLTIAFAAAGSAFAETPTVVTDNFVSTKSRAEVQAELAAYKRAGVNPWSTQYNPLRSFVSTNTRAQVVAGYLAARDEVAALNSEDSGSASLAFAPRANVSTTLAGDATEANRY